MNAPDKTASLAQLQASIADALRPQVDVTAPKENKPTLPYTEGFVNIGELTIKRLINGVTTELFSNDPVSVEVIVEFDGQDDPGNFSGHPDTWEPGCDADTSVFSAKAAEDIPMSANDGDEIVYVIQSGDELVDDLSESQLDDICGEARTFESDDEPDYESMRSSYDY